MNGPGASLDEQIVTLETALDTALDLLSLAYGAISDMSGATSHGNRSALADGLLYRGNRLREVLDASRRARQAVVPQ